MEKILLPFHLIILAVTAWNIILADHMGLKWIRGDTPLLDKNQVKKYHYRVLVGLILMIITGFLLFWPMKEFLLTRVQFFIKMGFVVALIINAFYISRLQKISITKEYSSLSVREKIPFYISGAISTACWVLAFAAGFFILP